MNTTVRTSSTSILTQIRNVNNRIACLTLKRINRTHSRADQEEIDRLQKKLDRLNREYTDSLYFSQQVRR